ncbi:MULTISPECIES: hypothetical protein [Rhodococcus]|nr:MULTISPECIES: hypothetical protein [Rhodococcus]NIL76943.1 hypothetical protein [Rhodococcus sp. B10]
MSTILDMHNEFERGDAWDLLSKRPDALLDSVRKFVVALNDFHADVQVDAFVTIGERLRSTLTERGRADAMRFFAYREELVENQVIAGNVRGLSDAGWIELVSPGRRGKRKIKEVPAELLDSGELTYGRYVRIRVSEQTAPKKKTVYRFKELLSDDQIDTDESVHTELN